MDKNAIKKYAVWARRELIEKVSQKALQYGIEEGKELDPKLESINGVLLTDIEKKQRQTLIAKVENEGFLQVMEEVAFTWFNRFIALRFMEVNGYLPSHIRVFTDENNDFNPQILSEALHLEFDNLDMDRIMDMKEKSNDEDLFRYLIIAQCNELNAILPVLFQTISDYSELLLPDYLLRHDSVISKMVEEIPETDWTDQVQIIGWLYQYYNTEPKDEVFAALRKNIKISKEKIPAATQLFTPAWIVDYMVENSLGRLWADNCKDEGFKKTFEYYLDEVDQDHQIYSRLETMRPEDIMCIDPCMGSGHILCIMFDVLVKIYENAGYNTRDAVESIVKNNIWGLDIDDRAAQLANFAVVMKARQYDRRFFQRKLIPNVYAFEETKDYTEEQLNSLGGGLGAEDIVEAKSQFKLLVQEMRNAKELGSTIIIKKYNWELLEHFAELKESDKGQINIFGNYEASNSAKSLIRLAKILSQKYDVVITNPPYMGNGGFSPSLTEYVKDRYPDSKNDLYSIMIEKCCKMVKTNGFVAMITMQSWINAATFKKMRRSLFETYTFSSINNLGSRAFEEISGEKVKNVVFIIRNKRNIDWKPKFVDLTGVSGENEKRKLYLTHTKEYGFSRQSDFLSHESCLVVYKTKHVDDIYSPSVKISDVSEVRRCIATGNDTAFLRMWHEVSINDISPLNERDENAKWFFVANGGERRRWYGNNIWVLNWKNDGQELRRFNDETHKATLRNVQYMFKTGLTYTYTSMGSGIFNARMLMKGMASIGVGPVIVDNKNDSQMFALVNSAVFRWFWDTMYGKVSTFETGNVGRIAYKEGNQELVDEKVSECIALAKADWDSYESSIDFKRHPLINGEKTIREAYAKWEELCNERIQRTRNAEYVMNTHLAKVYDLENEINCEVSYDEVTIQPANVEREVRSLISYAVGCMFGRYSLDVDGIAFAGGQMDDSKYVQIKPDEDGIIPICDDEYLPDDIVTRFIEFIRIVYGEEYLEDNLQYIADALDGKGNPRDKIRNYFLNGFYADHVKTYQKRPIYWMFDAGKKNSFKCLVYMHRYKSDTIAKIRVDYIHEIQARYDALVDSIRNSIDKGLVKSVVKEKKRLDKLKEQAEELHKYEEIVHHYADQLINISIDDGVVANYQMLKDVLYEIK